MGRPQAWIILSLALAFAPALPALAQPKTPSTPGSPAQPPLKRVEPNAADLSPLSNSLRSLETDLRVPTGYENIYRLDKTDIFGGQQALYMRMDGGLIAVFPQSRYIDTNIGTLPEVPPGTIYYLGRLPASLTAKRAPGPRPKTFVDLSAPTIAAAAEDLKTDTRASGLIPSAVPPSSASVSPARAVPSPTISIWEDERLRQRRLGALLTKLNPTAPTPSSPSTDAAPPPRRPDQ
jgi:hypothetical protein